MDILTLSKTLCNNPELCSVFDYKAVQIYIELINLLKGKLQALQNSNQLGPPPRLLVNVHEFLKKCFSMSDYMGKLAWDCFQSFAWNTPFLNDVEEQAARSKHLKLFLDHGISHGLGKSILSPLFGHHLILLIRCVQSGTTYLCLHRSSVL